ncbi:MAG: hypothetical protein MUE32_09125, partial [Bacteroidales bacterium]|nr:hypothetical protein [Bacteroidales bacterium]
MKRSLILTILAVAAMAALTLVLLLDRSPFGSSNSSFSADPSSDITAIHISDSKGELVLENRDGKWMTGGGAEVRRNGIA